MGAHVPGPIVERNLLAKSQRKMCLLSIARLPLRVSIVRKIVFGLVFMCLLKRR